MFFNKDDNRKKEVKDDDQNLYKNTTKYLQSSLISINNNNEILEDVSFTNIGEFYRDTCIFLTGATGFVGKGLLEKLLRTCHLIDTIYILLRPKRGMTVEQRFRELFKNPVINFSSSIFIFCKQFNVLYLFLLHLRCLTRSRRKIRNT